MCLVVRECSFGLMPTQIIGPFKNLYILIIFFVFSQLLPDPTHFSIHPISCSFSLIQNKTKTEKKIPNKTKRNNKTKQNQTESPKFINIWSQFCVAQLLLGMGPILESGWYTQWFFGGKKNSFAFPGRHGLQIAYWLWVGLYVYFSFSVLELYLVWTCADLVLGNIVSVSSYVYHSHCI